MRLKTYGRHLGLPLAAVDIRADPPFRNGSFDDLSHALRAVSTIGRSSAVSDCPGVARSAFARLMTVRPVRATMPRYPKPVLPTDVRWQDEPRRCDYSHVAPSVRCPKRNRRRRPGPSGRASLEHVSDSLVLPISVWARWSTAVPRKGRISRCPRIRMSR